MHRRTFIKGFGAGLAMSFVPVALQASGTKAAIPLLMFHKVDDKPRYPEDISTKQLELLFDYVWKAGFSPVNVSDIIDNKIDKIVPAGLKPLGITADDFHRSIYFSNQTTKHEEQRNARSFLEILFSSTKAHGLQTRASFFLSQVGDDRYSKKSEGYFGNVLPLKDIVKELINFPGIELGYHTVNHLSMKNYGAEQVKAVIEEQQQDFAKHQVLEHTVPILAYPFGVRPNAEGMQALKDLGFKGAVLAFPGVNEARYERLPACEYGNGLLTDPFLIPRVCIGSHTYATKKAAVNGAYEVIDPIKDFVKDVEKAVPSLYVSRG